MKESLPKVVVLDRGSLAPDSLDWSAWESLEASIEYFHNTEPSELKERAQGAVALLTNKVVIPREIMSENSQLKFIGIMATGANNVDLDAARASDIVVSNARDYGTESVAQHTWMLILSLSHRLYEYQTLLKSGAWSDQPFFALLQPSKAELTGQTLGIIGLGTLGGAVAQKAHAFGMNVCALESKRKSHQNLFPDVERLSLDALLKRSDVVSLHCPLSDENRAFMNEDTFQKMKPGALLVNTARGGLIDQDALLNALRSGHLGGAALDTLDIEPPPRDHPLLTAELPNLLITPHHAWGSQRSRQTLLDQTLENLRGFLDGSAIRCL